MPPRVAPDLRLFKRLLLVLAVGVALAGCEGGMISNHSQTCTSTGGLLAERTVTCTGEAQSLSGSVGIEFGDADEEEEELSGTYRLTAQISVQDGEARVYSHDPDGERLPLGTVSEGSPLRVEGVVIEPSGETSVFFVDVGDKRGIRGLKYEGRIEPA